MNIANLDTEKRNPNTMAIDTFSVEEILKVMNSEDKLVAIAVERQLDDIAKVIHKCNTAYASGGRIIYLGAGTSGRLAVLDAVECPPTFGVDLDRFIALIAGGEKAFVKAIEGSEDDVNLGQLYLEEINLNKNDIVIGIAASGRTPYVIGGLKYANACGCETISISFVNDAEMSSVAKSAVEVPVGPEVVTGSTRLKAGTATKLILNMISTTVMIKQNKVYQNLMVDLNRTNQKLVVRSENIVIEATECNREVAQAALAKSDGNAKIAIVMILLSISTDEARALLSKTNGSIAKAIEVQI